MVTQQVVRRRKVMIVEDDVSLREILQVLLQDYPHDFVFAESGGRALTLADSESPELVMIDLGLPDMHGFDLARELRQGALGRDARLIAFTGFDSDEYRRKADEAGFDDFYLKPMDLDSMEQTFERILLSLG